MTSEERHHRGPETGTGVLARWARAATGLGGDRPLPRPRSVRVEPIRRSWAGAFWQARIAVRAGMTADDFLRSRLARYLAALPVPGSRLPLDIDVQDGQLAVRPSPPERGAHALEGPEAWLTPLIAVEGPAIRQEVGDLEVRIAMLEGDIETARRRAEELSRRLAADVAAGIVNGPPEVNATAEQLGRPTVRSPSVRNLAIGFAVAALAAETWQIGQPILRSAGIEPAALGKEAVARPTEVAFALVFALGVAVGVFALAHASVGAMVELFRGDADVRRRRWLSAGAVGAAILATLVATAVSALPPPAGIQAPASAFVLLLVAVPLAAALVMRAGRAEAEQRAQELAAALAWDRERARALAERARRLEELDWAEEEERGLERQRDAARRRLKELNARAVAAGRIAAESERRERAALARLAQSIVAALELDRYEFVRQAAARGASELVAPRRRKPDPRPSFDEATAPVAAPVEAGRLAS